MALHTSDFDYPLPSELIAQAPPERRGGSRMLTVRRCASAPARLDREPEDRKFAELPELTAPGDLLVLNNTRVRHARLIGRRASGAPAEVLLIRPEPDGSWIALGKPGSALKPGKRVELGAGMAVEIVAVLDAGYRRVRLTGADPDAIIARTGRLPLPPYITRDATPEDVERYQTVYAEREGSVAAPTAGLHFTPELLELLRSNGVRIAFLDLEVGPGTFKPVEVEALARHVMHPERFVIPDATAGAIAEARARGGAVWAVGTTVVRALESAARPDGTVQDGPGETRLMIVPGYEFKVIDRLITNFHLPRSTLLMLVAAFAGYETTMAAYARAVRLRYRFYSYGDAMVVL